MLNCFATYSEKLGSHAKAAAAINHALGTDYSYKRVWEWATDRRPAPAAICNQVLKELKSKYIIPDQASS